MLATVTTEIELADAVYHRDTVLDPPQNDPYRLENFQQAYDNIVSGESKIVRASDEFAASARSVRKEFSATAKTQLKLKATHYALKFFQNGRGTTKLELDEQIKICVYAFQLYVIT